jgi:hypothetical protein
MMRALCSLETDPDNEAIHIQEEWYYTFLET